MATGIRTANKALALAVLLIGTGCSGDKPAGELPEGWHVFSRSTPTRQALECAGYSRRAWEVRKGGTTGLDIREWLPGRPVFVLLPFEVSTPGGVPTNEARHAVQVSGGWLAGFDFGEFGGGLYWYGEEGRESALLAPDNVRGIATLGSSAVALLGLPNADSGRVVLVSPTDGRWAVVDQIELGTYPTAFARVDDGALLVVTDNGLLQLTRGFSLEVLTEGPYVYANSVVRLSSGNIYVGMRAFVVRHTRTEEGWREDWLTPTPCPRLRRTANDCICVDPGDPEGRHRRSEPSAR